jgi:hypothetical protein
METVFDELSAALTAPRCDWRAQVAALLLTLATHAAYGLAIGIGIGLGMALAK